MKLSLSNFKHHTDLEVDLPETGLVRISGRSGAGKSSVVHAIKYALFGKSRGITTWNETKTEVKLEGLGLDILRTKGPNTVECNGVRSKAAEDEIQRVLGMNELEFNISSYVSQGQRSSLINLSPSEQLRLIHALSFRDEDPEEQKELIREFIKQQSALIVAKESEKGALKERISGVINSIRHLQALEFDEDADEPELLVQLELVREEIAAEQLKIQELRTDKDRVEELLNDKERSQADKARKELSSLQSKLEDAEMELRKPENKEIVADFSESDAELEEMKLELHGLIRENKEINSKQSSSYDTDRMELLLADALNKIQGIVGFGGVSREDDDLEDSLLTLQTAAESGLTAVQSIKLSSSKEEQEKLSGRKQEIGARIKEIKERTDSILSEKRKVESHNIKVQVMRTNASTLGNQFRTAELAVKKFNSSVTTEELQKQLEDIKVQGNSAISELNHLKSQETLLKNRLKTIEQRDTTLNKIETLKEELSDAKHQFRTKHFELKKATERHADAQRLQALWTKASLDVVESTIQEINLRASYWLEVLLEGKVSAELKTTKKVKSTKETVDSINLEILYKGQLLERVQEELSGGQYSRVMLAFQLALSDIYNSPILMLDEAARGCDLETIEIMLDALKTVSARKLVIILEHNVPSYHFDHEVKLADI